MKYAILSDIHANYTALKAVLERLDWSAQAAGEGHQIRFLGDLVGYGPAEDAVQCIKWLRFAPQMKWIPGNHDEWILKPNGGVRFEAKISLLSQKILLERPENESEWSWLQEQVNLVIEGQQPAVIIDQADGYCMGFTHASVMPGQERSSYLFPWQSPLVIRDVREFKNVAQTQNFTLFFGHTHFPMFARLERDDIKFLPIKYGVPLQLGAGPTVVNPGSIGQPRDGDPRASFAILDTDNQTITFHRVEYNVWDVCAMLKRESNINKINKPNRGDSNHPLTREERKSLINQLSTQLELQQLTDKIERANEAMLNTVQIGDGGVNMTKFSKIYARPKWDLEPN